MQKQHIFASCCAHFPCLVHMFAKPFAGKNIFVKFSRNKHCSGKICQISYHIFKIFSQNSSFLSRFAEKLPFVINLRNSKHFLIIVLISPEIFVFLLMYIFSRTCENTFRENAKTKFRFNPNKGYVILGCTGCQYIEGDSITAT